MLTLVANKEQPQFTGQLLTLVDMNKLCARLEEAMGKDISRSDLGAAIKAYGGKISRAGMARWFDKDNTKAAMKAEHVFPVAARLNVNPEWLANGKGDKSRGLAATAERLPPNRVALMQAYGTLSPEVRRPIRVLIETLAVASSPGYHRFEEQLAERTARVKETTEP